MVPAAEPIPATPKGAKSANRSALNAVNAMTTNNASTPSLITTMIVFTVADSLAPRISSSAHMTIRMMAGRLTMPGSESHGAADNALGMLTPNRLSSSLLTYPLQPTATAEMDTPYSSSRQAATPIATNSPSVVYA